MPEAAPARPPQTVTMLDSGKCSNRRSDLVNEFTELVERPVELVLGIIAASFGEMIEFDVFKRSSILEHSAILGSSITSHGIVYANGVVSQLC